MASIKLEAVSKVFPDKTVGLASFSLEIAPGELVVVVGPSGCGKTTLLRLIAGLDRPTSGRIRWQGEVANDWSPRRRNVALVADHGSLFPQWTVAENLAWSAQARATAGGWRSWMVRRKRGGLDERVAEIAAQLGLTRLLSRRSGELSAGEQQRVALGRSLLVQPAALLLDEPLARLDGPRRAGLARDLKRWLRQAGITTVYVTHDRQEAMALADRLVVLQDGEIQQVGAAREIYQSPANRFVAEMGSDGRCGWVSVEAANRTDDPQFAMKVKRVAALRPEAVALTRLETVAAGDAGRSDELSLAPSLVGQSVGQVEMVEEQGATRFVWVTLNPGALSSGAVREGGGDSGERREAVIQGAVIQGTVIQGTVVSAVSPNWEFQPGDRVRATWRWSDACWFEVESDRNGPLQERL